ncbi:MAG: hypothetical protein U1F43_16025 [Myxococcota bacterium]
MRSPTTLPTALPAALPFAIILAACIGLACHGAEPRATPEPAPPVADRPQPDHAPEPGRLRLDLGCTERPPADAATVQACSDRGCHWRAPPRCGGYYVPPPLDPQEVTCACVCPADIFKCASMP